MIQQAFSIANYAKKFRIVVAVRGKHWIMLTLTNVLKNTRNICWQKQKGNSFILDPKEGIKRKGERKHEENN